MVDGSTSLGVSGGSAVALGFISNIRSSSCVPQAIKPKGKRMIQLNLIGGEKFQGSA